MKIKEQEVGQWKDGGMKPTRTVRQQHGIDMPRAENSGSALAFIQHVD